MQILTLPDTRGPRHEEAVTNVLWACVCTALLSCVTHARLVSLSITKRLPVPFIHNPGQVEYELGVLMV